MIYTINSWKNPLTNFSYSWGIFHVVSCLTQTSILTIPTSLLIHGWINANQTIYWKITNIFTLNVPRCKFSLLSKLREMYEKRSRNLKLQMSPVNSFIHQCLKNHLKNGSLVRNSRGILKLSSCYLYIREDHPPLDE